MKIIKVIHSIFEFFKFRCFTKSFDMNQHLTFEDCYGRLFVAKSGKDFMQIFINFDNDAWLSKRLEEGYFEGWLESIAEFEILNIISDIKQKNPRNTTIWVSEIRSKLKAKNYFQAISVEQFLEAKLKEYETLRAEILFHMQNRTQIMLLGLTGIFAIAGLALTPLTDFFTAENITLPLKNEVVISIDDGRVTGQKITLSRIEEDKQKDYVNIRREIAGETINNKAIIPTVIILSIIIPVASLYIILRIVDSSKAIYRINEYIINGIERETSIFLKKKLENEIYYSKEIKQDEVFFNMYPANTSGITNPSPWQMYGQYKEGEHQLTETNFLSWERYMNYKRVKDPRDFSDQRIILIMISVFWSLVVLSLLGSLILLSYDFASPGFIRVTNIFTEIRFFWWIWLTIFMIIIFYLKNDLTHESLWQRSQPGAGNINIPRFIPLAIRFLLSIIFTASVLEYWTNFQKIVEIIDTNNFPIPNILLVGIILLQILGGISIFLGYKFEAGSKALIISLVVTTLTLNNPIIDLNEFKNFLFNLSSFGGLLLIIYTGPGLWSIDP